MTSRMQGQPIMPCHAIATSDALWSSLLPKNPPGRPFHCWWDIAHPPHPRVLFLCKEVIKLVTKLFQFCHLTLLCKIMYFTIFLKILLDRLWATEVICFPSLWIPVTSTVLHKVDIHTVWWDHVCWPVLSLFKAASHTCLCHIVIGWETYIWSSLVPGPGLLKSLEFPEW